MHGDGHVDLSFAASASLACEDDTSGALGMVTRVISPLEPAFHSKRGKVAIYAEVSDLIAECVLDEGSVKE